ncbi:MAG TPA: type II toxin-antitoxin system RelE/ParE family toxin [Lacipirellulaceae bacterium]|nr:type II toxin-antitoxin system RelE/ParE family toxin [Lacipirellulaceae bacterium]
MKRYRIAPAARDDLKQISRYIAVDRESPQGAKRLREQFLDAFRLLAKHPFLGHAFPEFGRNVRVWSVGNYLILYVPQENGIDVVQVTHGAQDLPSVIRKFRPPPQ